MLKCLVVNKNINCICLYLVRAYGGGNTQPHCFPISHSPFLFQRHQVSKVSGACESLKEWCIQVFPMWQLPGFHQAHMTSSHLRKQLLSWPPAGCILVWPLHLCMNLSYLTFLCPSFFVSKNKNKNTCLALDVATG